SQKPARPLQGGRPPRAARLQSRRGRGLQRHQGRDRSRKRLRSERDARLQGQRPGQLAVIPHERPQDGGAWVLLDAAPTFRFLADDFVLLLTDADRFEPACTTSDCPGKINARLRWLVRINAAVVVW